MECLRAPDAYVGFVLRDERNPSAVSLGGVLASLRGETGGDRLSSSEPFVWIRRRQGDKGGGREDGRMFGYIRPHARAVSGSCGGKHQKSGNTDAIALKQSRVRDGLKIADEITV